MIRHLGSSYAHLTPPHFYRIFNGLQGIKIENKGKQSMLTFFNVSEEDYGNYTCVATNTLGITNASIILYGKSLPLITKHVNLCTQLMSSVTRRSQWASKCVKYLPDAIKSTSRRPEAPTNADDLRALYLWRFPRATYSNACWNTCSMLPCRVAHHIQALFLPTGPGAIHDVNNSASTPTSSLLLLTLVLTLSHLSKFWC